MARTAAPAAAIFRFPLKMPFPTTTPPTTQGTVTNQETDRYKRKGTSAIASAQLPKIMGGPGVNLTKSATLNAFSGVTFGIANPLPFKSPPSAGPNTYLATP